MIGIVLPAVVAIEGDGLVADDPGSAVGRGRIDAMGAEIRLGAGNEEGSGLMQDVEPLEIQIPAVHHADRARFRDQQVEDIDVAQLPVGDVNKARDRQASMSWPDLSTPGLRTAG